MSRMQSCAYALAWIAASTTLTGCGADLGQCDNAALDGIEAARPHSAQGIVQRTCANGICHSQAATGAARNGAPAGLDFDVLPLQANVDEGAKVLRAGAVVREWRGEMWDQIDSGDMPPEGFGMPLSGDDKETVRNWLACGAPVVTVPEPAPAVTPDWMSIFALFEERCLLCHTGQAAAGGGFAIGTAGEPCAALDNLVNVPATTDACADAGMLVVPGDPDASLLLNKVAEEVPQCGDRMPFGLPAFDAEAIEAIRRWIADGAESPTCD